MKNPCGLREIPKMSGPTNRRIRNHERRILDAVGLLALRLRSRVD